MPMTKEERAEYNREYYENHKEKLAKKEKEYRLNHKEKRAEYFKEYQKKNKEYIAKYAREYRLTPEGKKKEIISNWKRMGIKTDNYDMLYNNYLSETHCDFCRVKFGKKGDGTGSYKCCDHDHTTGLFRNFLCSKCNLRRG